MWKMETPECNGLHAHWPNYKVLASSGLILGRSLWVACSVFTVRVLHYSFSFFSLSSLVFWSRSSRTGAGVCSSSLWFVGPGNYVGILLEVQGIAMERVKALNINSILWVSWL